MKFVALISGGKDSFYNIHHCLAQGHELVALANLYPKESHDHEIDSFMFQTVGHTVIDKYPECLGVPLYRHTITKGGSINQDLEYSATQNDEVEDLFNLLQKVKSHHPDIQGVSCGAILSHYQRTRVEHVCDRIGLTSLTYLWQRLQYDLMKEMCDSGLDARIIKVAAIGLDHSHLGKLIQQLFTHLVKINQMYQVHICGEGGEFETLVLDAPFFKRKLQITSQDTVKVSSDGVSFLRLEVEVIDKEIEGGKPDGELVSYDALARPAPLTPEFKEIHDDLNECELQAACGHLCVETDLKQNDSAGSEDTYCETDAVKKLLAEISLTSTSTTLGISTSYYETTTSLHICDLVLDGCTVQEQIRDIFHQLKTVLDSHACSFRNIKHVTLLLQDMADFVPVNQVYSGYFANQFLPPLRVCVATHIDSKVQLSCIVLKPGVSKSGIHIRSRSYWAPQNIGPYSQAIVELNEKYKLAMLSGQIPLVPATMDMADHGPCHDAVLALQHLDRVKSLIEVPSLAYGVCFISSVKSVTIAQRVWTLYSDAPLIIVKVTSLPRNASIEWSGLSYQKSVGMYDDFSDSEDSENEDAAPLAILDEISKFEAHSLIDIGDTQNCAVALTNDDSCLERLTTAKTMMYVQVFAQPLNLTTAKNLLRRHSIETVPVECCYSKSQKFKYGLVIRFSK